MSRALILRSTFVVSLAVATLTLAGCDAVQTVTRARELTPHEKYAEKLRDAGLAQTAMGREWLAAADTVFPRAHRATLPFQETGFYDRAQARAVAWSFVARDGQKISISLVAEGQPALVFSDLFQVTGDTARPFERLMSAVTDSTNQTVMHYEARDSVELVIRVQPELLRGGKYHLTIETNPVLAFPVEGRGNSAAQSFWGVDRDGGRRSHQGVDIFAPRGTPVLAAIDGRIRSISPNNLGGNVVWQADEERGRSLYYAHLDRHYVTAGAYVRAGDTIGFVGNTGNARTTSPHLHFGIYRRGRGPIDPWPYVRRNTATLAPVRGDTARMGSRATLRSAGALRVGPLLKSDTLMRVSSNDTLQVTGASATFYRVETASGVAGYVPVASLAAARGIDRR
ncbi:MAG: peptidoglycan DD-metalloendopeptidase family protein [Gemmatimonas sp.]